MNTINIHEAKTHLSSLLDQVQAGEEIVIAKAGHPIARLVRYTPAKQPISPPGALRGQITMADDFDAPVDELFDSLAEDQRASDPA